MKRFITALVVSSSLWIGVVQATEPSPLELFEQRIVPIFKSPEPSSCVQCHLSSVDLKDYILPSSRDTFLSLRDQGLINVDSPESSKILNLIAMGEQDSDPLATRIHAKMRDAEYQAFAAWIKACCADAELVAAKGVVSDQAAGPKKDQAIVRHNRKDRILDSFVRNIWSQRMRCFPCHTPDEIDLNNPMHKEPAARHKDFVAQYGQRMNIFKASPEATLRALVASSRKQHGDDLPLINIQQPLQSLLLLKPTAKLPPKQDEGGFQAPSSQIPVSHMGGIKMHGNDHSYKAFASWLQDYSKSVSGAYDAVEDLPQDNWFPTEHVLQIKFAPEDWPVLSTVQLFVFPWDGDKQAWAAEPIAFTQGMVAPRRLVSGSLFMLASAEQRQQWKPEGEQLAAGKYLITAYVDRDKRLESDPRMMLRDDAQPDATCTLDAAWGLGFKNAQVIPGESLQKKVTEAP